MVCFILNQIDYVRIKEIKFIDHLPIHRIYPNVPKAFKDKYFSKREIENLMELEEIIS